MADDIREHGSLLAGPEKRLLIAIARRLPVWVTSDRLTVLALVSMCLAGAGFALARWDTRWLWMTVVALAANWFGDSLDGTVARVRRTERPRYGFYVDHVVDILGITALFAGLASSPYMSAVIALTRTRGIPARLGRSIPRDCRPPRLPDVVRRHRSDGTAHSSRGRGAGSSRRPARHTRQPGRLPPLRHGRRRGDRRPGGGARGRHRAEHVRPEPAGATASCAGRPRSTMRVAARRLGVRQAPGGRCPGGAPHGLKTRRRGSTMASSASGHIRHCGDAGRYTSRARPAHRARRAHAQPQERRCDAAFGQADHHYRRERLGKVVAGLRHHLRRRAASLRGVAVGLRAPVPRAHGEARRRSHRRHLPGYRDPPEEHRSQPEIHGRHHHRDPRLHAAAVRARRPDLLPPVRAGGGARDGRGRRQTAG